jgi:hypothetical protein
MVVNVSSHGAITLRTDEGTLFKVNGQHLKIFLEPIRPSEVVHDLDFIIFFSILDILFPLRENMRNNIYWVVNNNRRHRARDHPEGMTCGADRPGLWPLDHPTSLSPLVSILVSLLHPSSSKSRGFNRQIAYSSVHIHYSLDLDLFCKPNPHINTYPCLLQPHPI